MPDDYTEFFLNSSSNIIQYETLEITHTNFSKVWYLVRNAQSGLTAFLEDLITEVNYEFCPMGISESAESDDLDFGLRIELGDVGEILSAELDNIVSADNLNEKPILKYRTYRSDILTQPMLGPFELDIEEITFDKQGATFQAKAPTLSLKQTGELYTTDRFPGLKEFLK